MSLKMLFIRFISFFDKDYPRRLLKLVLEKSPEARERLRQLGYED